MQKSLILGLYMSTFRQMFADTVLPDYGEMNQRLNNTSFFNDIVAWFRNLFFSESFAQER